jgi:hypothetical protein
MPILLVVDGGIGSRSRAVPDAQPEDDGWRTDCERSILQCSIARRISNIP